MTRKARAMSVPVAASKYGDEPGGGSGDLVTDGATLPLAAWRLGAVRVRERCQGDRIDSTHSYAVRLRQSAKRTRAFLKRTTSTARPGTTSATS